MVKVSKYGPAVIGEAAYEEEQQIVRMGADKYGPAILDHPGTETATTTEEPEKADEHAGAEPYVTLADFEAELGDDPERVVPLLLHELDRASGPRKGALHALRKVETSHESRPDVLTMIDEALG